MIPHRLRLTAVGIFSLASVQCMSITEAALITVNLESVEAVYDISPSANPTFGPPTDCETIDPATYIDSDYDVIKNARIYDIHIETIGSFAGEIQNGVVTVNGTDLLLFQGGWNAFNTAQSVLNSEVVELVTAGLDLLTAAVDDRQPITICGAGQLSQPIEQTGLQVRVEVFGQVDSEV